MTFILKNHPTMPQLHVSNRQTNLITENCIEAKPWISLFSSLYLAEIAASKQASLAAKAFRETEKYEIANFYVEMEAEERQHSALVRNMFQKYVDPPTVAKDIYAAKRCLNRGEAELTERLALVHLVFEPSALAFLSHIFASAHKIFEPDWAYKIQSSCRQILADEAFHVRQGRNILAGELALRSSVELALIRKSVITHRAFLMAGIRRFFRATPEFAKSLNERYAFAFENAVSGIIDGVSV